MTDSEVMQWFFDLESVTKGFNWPVGVARLIDAKRRLDSLLPDKQASADDVLQAYLAFDAAVGPTVMNTLLQADDAFSEVNHSGKPTPPANGKVTLFVGKDGRRVMAECTNQWGMPAKFTIE